MGKSFNENFWLAVSAGMVKYIIVAAILIVVLAGCAANPEQKAQEMEHLLIAAGFQMKLADTPQKLEHLKTLNQLKFIRHQREGKVNYFYADANESLIMSSTGAMLCGKDRGWMQQVRWMMQAREWQSPGGRITILTTCCPNPNCIFRKSGSATGISLARRNTAF
jgi:hypothetical protein